MIRLIATKELRELARDGRFRLAGAVVLVLLVTTLGFGWRLAASVAEERSAAQQAAEESWQGQGDKNPHVAAHYGKYVFKPLGTLAFLDPGVDPFLGVTLKLEAHKQNLAHDAPAQDATAIHRFGQLSAASVLQLFVPLLLIALGFAAWTGERERGTLRQLASTGVSMRHLLLGKALGLAGALAGVLLPAVAVAVAMAAWLGGGADPGWLGRLALMVGAYGLYFGAMAGLVFFVSARAPSSRHALVVLVGFWSVTSLVVPRVASDVAARVVSLPAPAEFAAAVRHSMENGLPGGAPREERVSALSAALLKRHGFEGAEAFMDEAMLQGIELQAEAAFEDEVLDHHVAGLATALARQERVAQWAAVASPFLAIRAVSSGLAGTDHAHHRAFQVQAEAYRRALVQALNDDLARNAGDDVWRYQAGRALWERAPVFAYVAPGLGWALDHLGVALAVLVGWLALAWAAAWRSLRRIPLF
ncbi:MAG: DUF3526 domain-containing protein [Myxococcales bacterium]|nr:DUF3526 domain-containing protein [Myxococcales bacterium]